MLSFASRSAFRRMLAPRFLSTLSGDQASRKKGASANTTVPSPRSRGPGAKRDEPSVFNASLLDGVVNVKAADILANCHMGMGLGRVEQGATAEKRAVRRVYFIREDETANACARLMTERKVGALLVRPTSGGGLAGIISERDLVRNLAYEPGPKNAMVPIRELMTPREKVVYCEMDTGVGHCMELMRKNSIRHLPVIGTAQDEEVALEVLKKKMEECKRVHSDFQLQFVDAYGAEQGAAEFAKVSSGHEGYLSDERSLFTRCARAAGCYEGAKKDYDARLHAPEGANLIMDEPVGILSLRDILLSVSMERVRPIMQWLDEEKTRLIEERVGYSE